MSSEAATSIQSTRERLIGCWRLVNYEIKSESGETRRPIGDDPRGTILYTQDGYMSAQLVRPGPYDQNDQPIAYYIAYSGPYDVDEQTGMLTHHVQVSVIPSWLGTAQMRQAHFYGRDVLVLSEPKRTPEDVITHILTWAREPSRFQTATHNDVH